MGPQVRRNALALEAKLTMATSKSSRTRRPAPVRSSPTSPARNTSSRNTAVAVRGGRAPGARAQAAAEPVTPAAPERTGPPTWLQLVTFVLAIAGLAVSAYLTYLHFSQGHGFYGCAENGLVNCEKVTTSAQSYVFGIPVALLGLLFYALGAVPLMSPWAWRASRREIHLARLAAIVVGVGFVLYLLYCELFIIGSICLYCTSVHVITFLLFVLTVSVVAMWGFTPAGKQPAAE
jgi:uncharacterized membrane protein